MNSAVISSKSTLQVQQCLFVALESRCCMPGIDADGINLKISLRMEPENFSQDGTKKSLVAGLVAARFSGMQSRSA